MAYLAITQIFSDLWLIMATNAPIGAARPFSKLTTSNLRFLRILREKNAISV